MFLNIINRTGVIVLCIFFSVFMRQKCCMNTCMYRDYVSVRVNSDLKLTVLEFVLLTNHAWDQDYNNNSLLQRSEHMTTPKLG